MLLENLNQNQKKAILNTFGPTMIIAGPGTGKTFTIISKIAYIIKNHLAPSFMICALTFTNKAANEMIKRVGEFINEEHSCLIKTYHGFGAYFLRRHVDQLNKPKLNSNFNIIDQKESLKIIRDILKKDYKHVDPKNNRFILEWDSNIKQKWDIEYPNNNVIDEKECLEVINKYINFKQNNNLVDYADLLSYTYQILNDFEEIKIKWKTKFKFWLIDEFQDTNNIQYSIIKLLTDNNSNITVVGDPDQTIYTWRGANNKIIKDFYKDYPNMKEVVLDHNYRSQQNILDLANSFIQNNRNRIQKNLYNNNYKEPFNEIIYNHFNSNDEESFNIANEIYKMIRKYKLSYNDFAILYRNNSQSNKFETQLKSSNIPYKIYGSYAFFDRKEIKLIINILNWIVNDNNYLGLNIILNIKRIGESFKNKISNILDKKNTTLQKIFSSNWKENIDLKDLHKIEILIKFKILYDKYLNQDIVQFFNQLNNMIINNFMWDQEKITDRKNNLNEFGNMVIEYIANRRSLKSNQEEIEEFLQNISLETGNPNEDKNDCVKLMTLHASKGTEAKVVFLVGLVQNFIPKSKTGKELEEERRLLYVGITRAKEYLFLSSYEGYNFIYKSTYYKSEFIGELGLMSKEKKFFEVELDLNNKNNEKNNNIFKTLDYVEHDFFGEGQIIKILNNVYLIKFSNGYKQINFNDSNLKIKK